MARCRYGPEGRSDGIRYHNWGWIDGVDGVAYLPPFLFLIEKSAIYCKPPTYYRTGILLRFNSSNAKVRDPCPMSRLSHDLDAIGKTDI
jgi:hypothetical protein